MSSNIALILGVLGQDGALLAKFLLNQGYQVIGQSRQKLTASRANLVSLGIDTKVKIVSLSLLDYEQVLSLLSSIRPAEIYNLSGQSSVGASFSAPLETFSSQASVTLNLLEAIRAAKLTTKIFNAGSGDCYGETYGLGASENNEFLPSSPYALSKVATYWSSKIYRDAYGLHSCTGMLFNHESQLRPDKFVTKKIVKAACRIAKGSDEILKLGNLNIRRDWGSAVEYVEAMWRVLQYEYPDDYVIATGESNSLEDFVSITFKSLGLNYMEHVEIDHGLLRPADIKNSYGDARKAQLVLGWKAKLKMKDVIESMISFEV
jgi:GDPmannose 4,6-dehydratase